MKIFLWSMVKKPTTAGADNGQSSAIVGGELVTGYFADGDDAQIPIIDGIIDRWSNLTTFSKQELKDGANPYKSGHYMPGEIFQLENYI